MKSISDKRRAERLANGERFIGSSIAPKPVQPQPSSGYCPIRRKRKVKKAKPIPKSNPERQAKVAKRQRVKHAGYMKSETRKTVEARSGGQCERIVKVGRAVSIEYTGKPGATYRCESAATTHHHKTYARYGGNELPEDIDHVCDPCHDYFESLKPAGNRFTRNRRGQ